MSKYVVGIHADMARKAAELLADGEWHRYEEIMQALIPIIPPGIAVRKNEADRANTQKQKYGEVKPRRFDIPTEQAIRAGARTIVRDFLANRASFEIDVVLPVGRPRKDAAERFVRMVKLPRAVRQDGSRDEMRRRRENTINRLQRQLRDVRAYLVEIGHTDAADRLIPKEDQ